jgi:hypothetical protein
MSLEQCLNDAERRQEVVRKGKIVLSVDWSMSEMWAVGVKENVAALEGRGRLEMTVVGEGVGLEGEGEIEVGKVGNDGRGRAQA